MSEEVDEIKIKAIWEKSLSQPKYFLLSVYQIFNLFI